MKKNFRIPKSFLYLITNAAFLMLLTNINVTCIGPGYQPTLPSKVDHLKRYKDHE